jgi:tRNA1Val (adenine37-N6)-methyltransferase
MIAAALRAALGRGEVVSPLEPRGEGPWPEGLRAGVIEARRGYRFRSENLWLPHLLRGGPPARRVVDLGAGSGSLLLAACYLLDPTRAVGVEIQEESAARLGRTLRAHGRREAAVVRGDLREPGVLAETRETLGGPADLAIANPPFFPAGWGRPSTHAAVHSATHALSGGVAQFLAAARALLAPDGQVLLLYEAGRLAEALAAAGAQGFALRRLDLVPDETGAPFRAWCRLDGEGAGIGALGG